MSEQPSTSADGYQAIAKAVSDAVRDSLRTALNTPESQGNNFV